MDSFECQACGPVDVRDPFSPFCPGCGEPLFVSRPERSGRRAIREHAESAIEKFLDFLPLSAFDAKLSLGEGNTPLLPLNCLGPRTGLSRVFAKNEAQNPTGSFKDRGTAVAVQKAVASGVKSIGTVSTGNMAASTAAYGARAGLETFVLLKEGTPAAALQASGIYGPHLITVDGDYGALFHKSLEIGKRLGISFMNSIDPFRIEGYKVTGYEIFLQLGRRAPRFILVPLSSGGHLLGLMRAFEDLEREGMIADYPTFVGVQALGCAPLVQAFEAGRPTYERLKETRTIAHAISNPAPPAGNATLRMIRARAGRLVAVSDEEMLEAQRELAAKEGLFCQAESATTVAALKKLAGGGVIGPGDEAVLVLTGSGSKTPPASGPSLFRVHRMSLTDLDSQLFGLLTSKM
jgi:threonine synthase